MTEYNEFAEMMLSAVVAAARIEANVATDPRATVTVRLQAIEYCLFTVQGPVLGPHPDDARYKEASDICRHALKQVQPFLSDVVGNSRAPVSLVCGFRLSSRRICTAATGREINGPRCFRGTIWQVQALTGSRKFAAGNIWRRAMKRLTVIISLILLSVAASTSAGAQYSIIRWTSGYCQIWDTSTPWKPMPSDYKTGRQTFKTFEAATAMRAQLISKRFCS